MRFAVHPWRIGEDTFPYEDMRVSESLTSLGNGYMGLRGNFEEDYTGDSHQGMYLGGVWFPDKTRVGWWKNGYPAYFGKVINAVRVIGIRVRVDGAPLDLARAEIVSFTREVDMHTGLFARRFTVRTPKGRVSVRAERFVSLAEKELLAISYAVTADYDCEIEMRPYLDANVRNEDANYDESFWDMLADIDDADGACVAARTKANPFGAPRFTVAAAMSCWSDDLECVPRESAGAAGSVNSGGASANSGDGGASARSGDGSGSSASDDGSGSSVSDDSSGSSASNSDDGSSASTASSPAATGYVERVYRVRAKANVPASLEKFALVFTSRDVPEDALIATAQRAAARAREEGYAALREKHTAAWAERWRMADVAIVGDDAAQQGIRFNLFHLLSTYSGDDARLNIGPKGFTGEKYGGATYWDTEAYCLPVYMAVAGENVARQLLAYRYLQLPQAYENARAQGLAGALYPMVTFTGLECHNEWEITFEEIHRNAAIAHAIFDYTTFTGDDSRQRGEGLEVLLGIARFWAGRVHFSKRAGKYMIHGVTGPNEYENNVNNNWYTNRMAVFCLEYFCEACAQAGERRAREIGVTEAELSRMRVIAENMYLPFDAERGVFVQHDTFLDKDLMPAADLLAADRPINQHWSWDRILRSCFIKQADVLQGMYFLNHLYDTETVRRNFDFYEPMTVHESSLSPCVHSILACQLGYGEKALEMYARTARLDLDNVNHDTADGLHITSMAGSYLSIAHGFAGMRTACGLSFAPMLPKAWQGYAFRLNYRGRLIGVQVTRAEVALSLESGEPLELRLYGEEISLRDKVTRSLGGK